MVTIALLGVASEEHFEPVDAGVVVSLGEPLLSRFSSKPDFSEPVAPLDTTMG